MIPTTKPRADAKLKTLPEERQAQIIDFARTHSLSKTVQWLREAGLSTSMSAVSQFLRWCRLYQRSERNESELRTAIADLARPGSMPIADRLGRVGDIFFAGSALEKQDSRAWLAFHRNILRKEEMRFRNE